MTTDPTNTTTPRHILWLFIVHILKALGPKKSRKVLADVMDLMRDHDVWPSVFEDLSTELSEAFVYSIGLKSGLKDIAKESIRYLKLRYAQEHIMSLTIKGDEKVVATEIKKLKKEGFLPQKFSLIPLASPDQFIAALKEQAGYEEDEWGATKGCDCMRCIRTRESAMKHKEQGFNPKIN